MVLTNPLQIRQIVVRILVVVLLARGVVERQQVL
jgi:hypothetical protein